MQGVQVQSLVGELGLKKKKSHHLSKAMFHVSILSSITFIIFLKMSINWIIQEAIILIYLFYSFMAVLGLRFCARAFSSCGKRGPLFIAGRRPRTIAASLVAEHRLQTHRLSNCGSRAQLLRGMWDLPGPGLEPVSPALVGRFSTTAPPGKPQFAIMYFIS